MAEEIHQDIFLKLVEWASKSGRRNPVAVFVYGGPGVGKTTLAYRVCAASNLQAVECNASHVRNRAGVAETIQPLLQRSLPGCIDIMPLFQKVFVLKPHFA